jgi:sulfate/thiosulfate transport system permease protein
MSATVTEMPAAAASTPSPAKRADLRRRRWIRILLTAIAVGYVTALLFLPLAGIVAAVVKAGWSNILDTLKSPAVQHAFVLTAIIAVITVIVTTFFGVLVAWVLVRQHFRGKGFLNALVDLPFALSPVTVGLAALLLFGRGGWFTPFFEARGIQIVFAIPAMVLVTIFISIPFVIREVQPVLQELGKDEEDASRTLGASISQTFRKVTLPNIRWALLYGMALSAARAIGEIGAVLLVSGNLQGKTWTATLFIYNAFEQRHESQAYVVALMLAAISIVLLAGIETAKHRIGIGKEKTT